MFFAENSTIGTEYILSVAQEDITDQSIAYYLTEFEGLPQSTGTKKFEDLLKDTGSQNATFPQGSMSFTIDPIRVNEEFEIGNAVVYAGNKPLQTLDDMFVSADTVAEVKNDINIERFSIYDHKLNNTFYYELIANKGNSGAILYYLLSNGNSYDLAKEQGTWEKKTVGGEDIIWITHPKVLNGNVIKTTFSDEASQTFYAAPDGFVRQGSYSPANYHFYPDRYGNKTATEAVLSAFGIAIYPAD